MATGGVDRDSVVDETTCVSRFVREETYFIHELNKRLNYS